MTVFRFLCTTLALPVLLALAAAGCAEADFVPSPYSPSYAHYLAYRRAGAFD